MLASTLNGLLSALQHSSMCKGPILTSALLSTMLWHVGTMQAEVWQALPHNPTNITPTQSDGLALGVKKTALTTETSLLQHTDKNSPLSP